MADLRPFYPPSPAGVPPDLTEISPAYRTRVLLLLAVVIAFFGVYFALIGLALLLMIAPVVLLPLHGNWKLFVLSFILAGFGLLMLIFLIKALFKHGQ